MEEVTRIPLVSTEISAIWNSYIDESLLVCVLKYFSNRVDDNDTKIILQEALQLSNERVIKLRTVFCQEGVPVPQGFTESDVNVEAPRLFTDVFYVKYLEYASRIAIRNYDLALTRVAREDVRGYLTNCIFQYIDLYNRSTDLSLAKGIYIRAPRIEIPKEVQMVQGKGFMANWIGKKRNLLTDEISQIFAVTNDTAIRKGLVIGFSQVCKDKDICNYLLNVVELAKKQNDTLEALIKEENIPIAAGCDSYVTDSTVSPFSEKLMLAKLLLMYAEKINTLGTSLAFIRRSDLKNTYLKILEESMGYAQNGADIMIEKGWMEQPPQAINHENLVGV